MRKKICKKKKKKCGVPRFNEYAVGRALVDEPGG